MKRNVLLISNSGNDVATAGTNGEVNTGRTQQAFEILSLALDEIDLAIVDIGVGMQSLRLVEVLAKSEPAPPVIALVDGKHKEAIPVLHRHGAAACLTKPFSADELARLIAVVCAQNGPPSCDKRDHSALRRRQKHRAN